VTAFILDLDGTLVDSVYQHVVAWHTTLRQCGMPLPMWRLHRKIGMSGGFLMNGLAVELGRSIDEETAKTLQAMHGKEFAAMRDSIRPFPGSNELLRTFEENGVQYAIATTGRRDDVQPLLDMLEVPRGVPVLFKEDAANPKPSPDLFLSAAKKLGTRSEETMVVGDSVWDMLAARRAHFLGIGLLCGGYAESEMTGAGAFRVYADPAQLREHLHEAGVTLKERQ
jgi:HAD superfamily hydrolase (TIGR01509 family)